MRSSSFIGTLLLVSPAVAGELPPIELDAVVHAPVSKVWAAWTTKEGMESWMVAHAEVEMKVGGLWRTHYKKEGKIGDPGTIENELLAFDPQRMFALRIKKFPDGFPFQKVYRDMWTVVYLEPVGADKTKVTVRSLGFQDDEESKKMRAFFEQGNRYELDELVKHFGPK